MIAHPSAPAKPRLCFVLLNAYNVLADRPDLKHIGGAEVLAVTLARELVELGYPVHFVTYDHDQPRGEDCNGITVHPSYRPDAGWPMVRFVHPRWTKLNDALARADADIYLQPCSGVLTGQVAWWCRRHHRKFVYVVASDLDCFTDLPKLRTYRERVLYRQGLRWADRILALTQRQQQLLRDDWQLASEVVYPTGGSPAADTPQAQYAATDQRVLWVGRFHPIKRMEWLLEVARQLPQLQFDLVGGSSPDDPYGQRIVEESAGLANVHLHGPVHHTQLGEFYRRAQALLLTSKNEGFPTVFLEAWSHGVPTVSSLDFDALIATHDLGVVADTPTRLASELQALLGDPARWAQQSRHARAYYMGRHTPKAYAAGVSQVLEGIALSAGGGRAEKRVATPG